MPPRRSGLPALGLVLTLLAAGPLATRDGGSATSARRPTPAPTTAPGQLHADGPIGALARGRLLVASRRIGDPNFVRSVVLLLVYSATEGAAGVIVNRPTPVPVERLLPDLPVPRGPGSQLFFGGPVALPEARALLRMPASPVAAPQVLPGVYLFDTQALNRAVGEGVTASQLRVYVGYAGWGAGQLEREIRRRDWHVFDAESAIVFDPNPETVWERQIVLTELIEV
jgi:putative transcriptional regulator